MRVLGDLGLVGALLFVLLAIGLIALGVVIWRAAPGLVKRFEDHPDGAPSGWLGDKLPSVASVRCGAIGGFVAGAAALWAGISKFLSSL